MTLHKRFDLFSHYLASTSPMSMGYRLRWQQRYHRMAINFFHLSTVSRHEHSPSSGVIVMKCLVVVAHPLTDSLCHAMAQSVIGALSAAGHEVVIENLYQSGFPPALTVDERQTYYRSSFDSTAVRAQVDRLLSAEALVLVFPTWWFGFPAILKGWFDRVWAPGIAYDHASDLGPIKPRLLKLRRTLAITSLGSPWWVDRFVLRQPVKRVLKAALLGTCAPACRFEMLSLYKAERLSQNQVQLFCSRIEKVLARWP